MPDMKEMPGIYPRNACLAQLDPISRHIPGIYPFWEHIVSFPRSGPARDLANFGGAVSIYRVYAWWEKTSPRPPWGICQVYTWWTPDGQKPPRDPLGTPKAYARYIPQGQNLSEAYTWYFLGILNAWEVFFRYLLGIYLKCYRYIPTKYQVYTCSKDLESPCVVACGEHWWMECDGGSEDLCEMSSKPGHWVPAREPHFLWNLWERWGPHNWCSVTPVHHG